MLQIHAGVGHETVISFILAWYRMQHIDVAIKSKIWVISKKSVLNFVPRVPLCPTCFTCLRALRTHVPYVPEYLSTFALCVPSFFTCLTCHNFFYVPLFFTCLTCPNLLTCLTRLQFFMYFWFLTSLMCLNFFIKCGTTQNQPQQAGISKNRVE